MLMSAALLFYIIFAAQLHPVSSIFLSECGDIFAKFGYLVKKKVYSAPTVNSVRSSISRTRCAIVRVPRPLEKVSASDVQQPTDLHVSRTEVNLEDSTWPQNPLQVQNIAVSVLLKRICFLHLCRSYKFSYFVT